MERPLLFEHGRSILFTGSGSSQKMVAAGVFHVPHALAAICVSRAIGVSPTTMSIFQLQTQCQMFLFSLSLSVTVCAGGMALEPTKSQIAGCAEASSWLEMSAITFDEMGAVVRCLGLMCTKTQLRTVINRMLGAFNFHEFLFFVITQITATKKPERTRSRCPNFACRRRNRRHLRHLVATSFQCRTLNAYRQNHTGTLCGSTTAVCQTRSSTKPFALRSPSATAALCRQINDRRYPTPYDATWCSFVFRLKYFL